MGLFKKDEPKFDLPLPPKPTEEPIKEEKEDLDLNLIGQEDESFDKIVDMVRKKESETNTKTIELMKKSLIQNKDENNKYQYYIDSYDFIGEMKKYWAWIIAKGKETPIPAYIQEDL